MLASPRFLLATAFMLGFAVSTACKDDDCPTGTNGCACGEADLCKTGLTCTDGICVGPDGGDGGDGEECTNEGATVCADAETLATCTDGTIQLISCADACEAAGLGESAGCGLDANEVASCFCMPADGSNCDEPGAGVCASEDELYFCGEDGTWSLIDCDQSCADAGYDSSFGCEFSEADGQGRCICGEFCEEEGAEKCEDDRILTCTGGVWQYGDCAAACTGGSLGDYGHGTCLELETDAGCICYDETGGPCETESDQACLGSDDVGLCLGGQWWYMECTNVCEANDCTGTTGCDSAEEPPVCMCSGCP